MSYLVRVDARVDTKEEAKKLLAELEETVGKMDAELDDSGYMGLGEDD